MANHIFVVVTKNLLGLGLPRLDAQFSDVELAAAPPVRPADDRVLLPAQLHDHQVSDVHIGGDEEGQSCVAIQVRPAGWKEEFSVQGSAAQTGLASTWKQ